MQTCLAGPDLSAATLLVAVTFCLAFGVLKFGTAEIVNYSVGRNPDGSVESVESFLKYGNNRRWFWSEALTRTSIYLDYNLYFGGAGPGANSVTLNPLFNNALAGDFSLQPTSPAINAGDPSTSATVVGAVDFAGNPRVRASARSALRGLVQ